MSFATVIRAHGRGGRQPPKSPSRERRALLGRTAAGTQRFRTLAPSTVSAARQSALSCCTHAHASGFEGGRSSSFGNWFWAHVRPATRPGRGLRRGCGDSGASALHVLSLAVILGARLN